MQIYWELLVNFCEVQYLQDKCGWGLGVLNVVTFNGPFGWVFSGLLTHRRWDKMAAILHRTFSNSFSWIKRAEFSFKFHWNLFPGFQITKNQHWSRSPSHYLNQWCLNDALYASLSLNDLSRATTMMSVIIIPSFYTLRNEVRGGMLDSACLSVRLSVCLSVR